MQSTSAVADTVSIPSGEATLQGALTLPRSAKGFVIFAHGTGGSHRGPRNVFVASALHEAGIGTLLFDLLTPREGEEYWTHFDVALLTGRLEDATRWARSRANIGALPLGYFGANTGAAAALCAAATLADETQVVVARGGRPDLAAPYLPRVKAATLLIVGAKDPVVLELNRNALASLSSAQKKAIEVVEGASHLFEEQGALDTVARLATHWFVTCLKA